MIATLDGRIPVSIHIDRFVRDVQPVAVAQNRPTPPVHALVARGRCVNCGAPARLHASGWWCYPCGPQGTPRVHPQDPQAVAA